MATDEELYAQYQAEKDAKDQALYQEYLADRESKTGFTGGLKLSGAKTLRGAGELLPKAVGQLLDRQGVPSQPEVEAWQREVDASGGMSGAGQFAGDLGQLALGGAKLIPSTIAAGVHGAVQNPQSPLSSAVKSAAGNVIGQGFFKGVKEAGARVGSKLFKPKYETKELMKQGIVPTLGRGTEPDTFMGGVAGRAEDLAETSRMLRGPLKAQVQQGDDALTEAALKRVGRTVPPATIPLAERVSLMNGALKRDYDAAYKGVIHAKSPKFLDSLENLSIKHELDPKTAGHLSNFYNQYYTNVGKKGTMSADALNALREQIRGRIDLAAGKEKAALIDAVKAVDAQLTSDLGKAGRDLPALDKQFAELAPINRALRTNVTGNPMSGQQYERAVRQNAKAIGKDPLSPSVPGAALSGPASRVLTKGDYSSSGVMDALLAGAASPVLRAGEWATKSPRTRQWLLGDQAVLQDMIQKLRAGGKADFLAGVAGQEAMKEEQ